jgi:hypothetical protein
MLRNLGISLLLFGLLAAGIDGFRVRERVRTPPSNATTDQAHIADFGSISNPPR